jgi:hypothetical protein
MPAEMPRVFFSYARADAEFVLKLAKDLRSAGANLWIDQLDIPAGDRWDRAVEDALKTSLVLLAVLSPASVSSHNVMDEISFALEHKKKIVPVVFRSCDIPFRLKRLQYIDFTVNYKDGCSKLLRALDVETSSHSPSSPSISETKPTLRRWAFSILAGFLALITIAGLIKVFLPSKSHVAITTPAQPPLIDNGVQKPLLLNDESFRQYMVIIYKKTGDAKWNSPQYVGGQNIQTLYVRCDAERIKCEECLTRLGGNDALRCYLACEDNFIKCMTAGSQ